VTLITANEELQKKVFESVNAKMNALLDKPLSKGEFYGGMDELQAAVVAEFCIEGDANAPKKDDVKSAFSEAEHKIVRERILSMGKRPDGRTPPKSARSGARWDFPRARTAATLHPRRNTSPVLCHTRYPGEAQELDTSPPTEPTLHAPL